MIRFDFVTELSKKSCI